jgi:hypothetical protein
MKSKSLGLAKDQVETLVPKIHNGPSEYRFVLPGTDSEREVFLLETIYRILFLAKLRKSWEK